MLVVSAETVANVNLMALKQTLNKSPKILVKLINVLINVYCKYGNLDLFLVHMSG